MKKKQKAKAPIQYNPDLNTGLNAQDVLSRTEYGFINRVEDKSQKSYARIIFDNTFTFFNLLMFAIAALFIIFCGISAIGNLSFLVIIIANIFIGTIQEIKSKNTIKRLKLVSEGKVKVIRNSEQIEISPTDIVLDDIIVLETGDAICADCVIRDGAIEVNESMLTGESTAIKKKTGDKVLSGSFVISGYAKVQAEKIATETYIYSIESKAREFKKPKSKLMKAISKLVKTLTIIAIPLSLLTLWTTLTNATSGSSISSIVSTTGSAIVGMVPCGMMLLASVAMATGVIKLGNRQTLVQDLYSVESLSRIDTLCLDKTGTLTDGTMTVERTIEFGLDDIDGIMGSYLLAFQSDNQTSKALKQKYKEPGDYSVVYSIPFSSARKYSAVEFENATFALGAPEYLTKDEDVLNKTAEYAKDGIRVVCLVQCNGKLREDDDTYLPKRRSVIALFLIRDTIRPEVKKTMKWFRDNDVDIRVISGDNPATVSYIAKHSGIENWNSVFDMSTLKETDDVDDIIMSHTIFARVSPEQKALIVDTLKAHGRNVGLTGDGVNDILAMKKSDCAIALQNGAPATKNIANLVLLDSNFSNMTAAVLEGRRVVNNVQRSSTLFLMKDFFTMFTSLFCILLGLTYPLETSLLTIINLLITGIGSVLLSIEPSPGRINGNFYKTVLGKSIPAGFFMFVPVLFLYIYGFATVGLSVSSVDAFMTENISLLAILVLIASFAIFYNVCRPFSKYRAAVYIILLIISLVLAMGLPDVFLNTSSNFFGQFESASEIVTAIVDSLFSFEFFKQFSPSEWGIIIGFTCLSLVLYRICDYLITKFLKLTLFSPKKLFDDD